MPSAFDLFGQASDPLPIPVAKYKRGPDWQHGPPRCRQNQQLCEYDQAQPHDHSCCCDPCRHNYINVCVGDDGENGCCRCVPKAICLTFTPDTPGEVCTTLTWKLTGAVVAQRGVAYSAILSGVGTITVFVGFPDAYNPLFGYAPCIWQLTAPDLAVDESVAVDHSGDVHCQAPPDWSITGVTITRGATECTGTLTIAKFELTKLPFVSRWWDVEEEFVTGLTCGTCSQFCQVLCVRRGDENSHTRDEFRWSDADQRWNANDGSGHFISLEEYGGQCHFLLEQLGGSEFEGDLLAIDPNACALGMDLTATGSGTNFISVSCNRCSCWKYVCGTCRCICQKLCLVGVINDVETRLELDWDSYNWRWGTAEFNVSLGADAYDNCVVTVTGFEGQVAIRNDCGSQIVFNVYEDTADMEYSGVVNYLYGFCRQCEGSCDQGSCLSVCEDVPQTLYCYLSPTDWMEMLGCDPYSLCFTPITIPLGLVYVGNEAAGEWRWIGCGIISCHDCNPPTEPRNFLVCVDLGCDGVGTLTGPCGMTFEGTIPCGPDAVWDIEFTTGPGCGAGDGCCDAGGFNGHITT